MSNPRSTYAIVVDVVTAIFFIFGIFAAIEFLAGKSTDVFGMGGLIIALGLFFKKAWSLIALRAFFIIQVMFLTPVLVLAFFSDSGSATLLIAGKSFEISSLFFFLFLALFLSLQGYAAFSQQAYVHFEEGK